LKLEKKKKQGVVIVGLYIMFFKNIKVASLTADDSL
jgi:hypothetical protein